MSYKIVSKTELALDLYEMEVKAPFIAKKAQPGHFLIYRLHEKGERVPLTIADFNREKGYITMVFQTIGQSTKELALLNPGDFLLDLVGPLGNPVEIENYGHVCMVAGGVGIAPIYPQARALKEAGNRITAIIGARTKDLLFWQDKMEKVADRVIYTTDDGSFGQKGVVTDPLKDILAEDTPDVVITIGPLIMMKFVTLTTNGKGKLPKVKTFVSLNTIMVDGTGMCGGCRVETTEGTLFVCVDGPDIDGHIITDFDRIIKRNNRFKDFEEYCNAHFDEGACLLEMEVNKKEKEREGEK